jgi:dTDP-4-dehydrorhamnose 3,5-epimerase
MPRFHFVSTPLPGLQCVERLLLEDHRGYLSRLFCAEEFSAAGFAMSVAQINHTLTRSPGTVRGLHFQLPPFAEMKLVTCIRGRVFDVAVDLRAGSPSFLRWHGEILSPDNRRALAIPQGFAHGFQALELDCELLYLHSAPYSSDAERALNPCDPRLAIHWPLPTVNLSERDRKHAMLTEEFKGIVL